MRSQEHTTYLHNKAEMEEGIEGVKLALKLLGEYYASNADHQAAEGAGHGIIGLLEVVESQFTKQLAEYETSESSAQAAYDRETKDNQVETATKNSDVQHKTGMATSLDKATTETKTDRDGVEEELSNVNAWMARLNSMCDETVISFKEKQQRMHSEIDGLKQALKILEDQGVDSLIQTRALRQVRAHKVCIASKIEFKQQTQDGESAFVEHTGAAENACTAQNFIEVNFCGAGKIHIYSDGVCGSGKETIDHGVSKTLADCTAQKFTNGMSFSYECAF